MVFCMYYVILKFSRYRTLNESDYISNEISLTLSIVIVIYQTEAFLIYRMHYNPVYCLLSIIMLCTRILVVFCYKHNAI